MTILPDKRAAITAPDRIHDVPGYFLILAKVGSRMNFVVEGEAMMSADVVKALITAEEEHRFNSIYLRPWAINKPAPLFESTISLVLRRNMPWVRQRQAFHANDPVEGVRLLDAWENKASIPRSSLLAAQIGRIDPDNIDDPALCAFTALRYILAGFQVDKGPDIERIAGARAKAVKKVEIPKLDNVSKIASDEYRRKLEEIRHTQEMLDERIGF